VAYEFFTTGRRGTRSDTTGDLHHYQPRRWPKNIELCGFKGVVAAVADTLRASGVDVIMATDGLLAVRTEAAESLRTLNHGSSTIQLIQDTFHLQRAIKKAIERVSVTHGMWGYAYELWWWRTGDGRHSVPIAADGDNEVHIRCCTYLVSIMLSGGGGGNGGMRRGGEGSLSRAATLARLQRLNVCG
jgi:hypothetical protein